MTGPGPLSITAPDVFFRARKSSPRVEKSAGGGKLNGEFPREAPLPDRRGGNGDRRKLSRTDTVETAPLWYGPRLRAPFVAQFIGQVLGALQQIPQSNYGEARETFVHRVDKRA